MDIISSEWGYSMAAIALLSVIGIFGIAYWFIRSATDSNKRFRWLQIASRRNRQSRGKHASEGQRR